MIKLIATDMDDTLLASDGQMMQSSVDTIQNAIRRGIKVVLCSGRPLAGLAPYMAQAGITGRDQYAITFNGAIIRNANGHMISSKLLSRTDYADLTEFGLMHRIPFNVLDADSNIYTADRNIDFITVVQAAENEAGIFCRQPDEMPAEFQIAKGAFVGQEAQLDTVEPLVRATYEYNHYVVRAGRRFLEVMHRDVSKGNALKELTSKLGISRDEVMVLGDEENDISMFDFAGIAVCMANGGAKAKAHADYITEDNDHDGWANAVRKFALV